MTASLLIGFVVLRIKTMNAYVCLYVPINITGISQTKWFNKDVYEVDGFVLVHSGRPIPADAEPAQRNEGVDIVLNPTMAIASLALQL